MHLTSTASMLPYMFITNGVNYSRWLPVYLLDMHFLPLDVQAAFESGQFAIRQKPGKLNGVWCDMATEKQSSETQKVVAVLLVLQGKRRLLSDGPLPGMFLQNLLEK